VIVNFIKKIIYLKYIMFSTHDYTFNNLSRIGNDSCDVSQRDIQNNSSSDYLLTNFKPECPMNSAVAFATSQPTINFTGSHQVGINGCNIDTNSKIFLSDLTRSKCKLSLMERPYMTVPFLGKGNGDTDIESKLQCGELIDDKRTLSQLSEVSYENLHRVPLIPSVKSTISNPSNLVEGVASDGWVRGGMPSREMNRDKGNE